MSTQDPATPTSMPSGRSTVLGFPRIGAHRELKKATEAYWAGDLDAAGLLAVGAQIRLQNWTTLRAAGVDQVPCNDFSFYDHMLDTLVLLGAIPARHDVAVRPTLPPTLTTRRCGATSRWPAARIARLRSR